MPNTTAAVDRHMLKASSLLQPQPCERRRRVEDAGRQAAYATTERSRAYLERVADVVEAERHAASVRHHPSRGLDEEPPLAHAERRAPVLQDVDRVGQHREHQPLLAGESALANQLEELARQDEVRRRERIRRLRAKVALPHS